MNYTYHFNAQIQTPEFVVHVIDGVIPRGKPIKSIEDFISVKRELLRVFKEKFPHDGLSNALPQDVCLNSLSLLNCPGMR